MQPSLSASVQPHPQPRLRRVSHLAIVRPTGLLAISEHCQGGLIIQKPFYTDFAGPGSAVGGHIDHTCTTLYVVGDVQIQPLTGHGDRQRAIQTRLDYAERLSEIINVRVPLRRGCLIINQLCQWMPSDHVRVIPAELLAHLVGILPLTVKLAWRCYRMTPRDIHSDRTTILQG